MSAIDNRRDRVKRVFERVDRKLLENETSSQDVRAQVARQVREVYEAAGESIDDETLNRAVDEVLAEEREKLDQPAPVNPLSKIPGWAWLPLAVGFVIIAVPVARILLRVIALVFRI